MKIEIRNCPFRGLARSAGGAALDAASVLREAAAAAGRQAEEAVSRLRLEREIRDLQEEKIVVYGRVADANRAGYIRWCRWCRQASSGIVSVDANI